ncbi:hypothetical protein ATANTOWER_010124 [Ataeniobius toweri]|uniref:Uncharacterized protein n=1 Tax=Ataeniobius toweri TaxID=208326 RepID=A0ABU7BF72_9TELE|nr:hypothetical protein [Ataeniobius toweri]
MYAGTMLKVCLRKASWPAVLKLPSGLRRSSGAAVLSLRLPGTARHVPSCWMGTHGRNDPREPLNSPKRAKEFIYRLHPNERTCLLKELQIFESEAIAQGNYYHAPKMLIKQVLSSLLPCGWHVFLLHHDELRKEARMSDQMDSFDVSGVPQRLF